MDKSSEFKLSLNRLRNLRPSDVARISENLHDQKFQASLKSLMIGYFKGISPYRPSELGDLTRVLIQLKSAGVWNAIPPIEYLDSIKNMLDSRIIEEISDVLNIKNQINDMLPIDDDLYLIKKMYEKSFSNVKSLESLIKDIDNAAGLILERIQYNLHEFKDKKEINKADFEKIIRKTIIDNSLETISIRKLGDHRSHPIISGVCLDYDGYIRGLKPSVIYQLTLSGGGRVPAQQIAKVDNLSIWELSRSTENMGQWNMGQCLLLSSLAVSAKGVDPYNEEILEINVSKNAQLSL